MRESVSRGSEAAPQPPKPLEEGGKGKGPEADAEGASFGEIALVLALGGGWLAALRVYGLPDL